MSDKNAQIATIKHDFEKLAATAGSVNKRKLINSFKGTITNRALRMYLDPSVKFKLRTNTDGFDTPEFGNFFALCKYLQENGGKDAERTFVDSLHVSLRTFVRDFLRGNLSLGVSAEDFNVCNPDKPLQRVVKNDSSKPKPKQVRKSSRIIADELEEEFDHKPVIVEDVIEIDSDANTDSDQIEEVAMCFVEDVEFNPAAAGQSNGHREGDVVTHGGQEYVFTGDKWAELFDVAMLSKDEDELNEDSLAPKTIVIYGEEEPVKLSFEGGVGKVTWPENGQNQ